MLVFMQSIRHSCHILIKLEFSGQIFEKYSNIKFHETPFSGSRDFPCGQAGGRTDGETGLKTDRYDEANIGFSQFWERA
jgi:hypothetical protein